MPEWLAPDIAFAYRLDGHHPLQREIGIPAMISIPIGAIIVAILFGSAMLSALVGRWLPEHHVTAETKNVVSVSMAVVGTLGALVLGLLISTANTSFTTKQQQVNHISAELTHLDRLLRRYGPEAQEVRALLRSYTAAKLQDLFPEDSRQRRDLENISTISTLEEVEKKILALTPGNETQRWLQTQSLQLAGAVEATRWQLIAESESKSPFSLVLLLLFWFAIVFGSFGLFAPRNMTAVTAMLLCSIGIGSAIRMTTELQTPFQGLIRISSAPLTHALEEMSR
jgi:hypothetical protein